MSRLDHIRDQLAAHGAALKGIEAIAEVARNALVSSNHSTIAAGLSVVLKIVEAVIDGFDGKTTPQDVGKLVDQQIQETIDRLASNDEKHDQQLEALDQKFDKGE